MIRRHKSVRALLIPTDESKPIEQIKVRTRDDIAKLLTPGPPETAQYDLDAQFFYGCIIFEHGPWNRRANNWIHNYSDSAKQGRMRGVESNYGIFGATVLTGIDDQERMVDVPHRFLQFFEPVGLDAGASL